MKTTQPLRPTLAADAALRVHRASANRDWADPCDRMEIAANLGNLRRYFAWTMLRATRAEERQGLRHQLERAVARTMVCDMAKLRLAEDMRIERVALEGMAETLKDGKPSLFPAAKKFASIVRDRGALGMFPNGPLSGYATIAGMLSDPDGNCSAWDAGRLAQLVELAGEISLEEGEAGTPFWSAYVEYREELAFEWLR